MLGEGGENFVMPGWNVPLFLQSPPEYITHSGVGINVSTSIGTDAQLLYKFILN